VAERTYTDHDGYEWIIDVVPPALITGGSVVSVHHSPALRFSRPRRWRITEQFQARFWKPLAQLDRDELDELFQDVNQTWAEFLWCLHCEQAYPYAALGVAPGHDGPGIQCPINGCDGKYVDRWEWDEVRAADPTYPEIPAPGRRYLLNGLA
jgi:hypothetical protein